MNQSDISNGLTNAEKFLAKLCQRSFLSFWSYPNVFTDQGKIKEKPESVGTELCDLLVVFDNHIIIFSSKDCAYPNSDDPILNWCRWFKKAIWKSSHQIYGAERWIEKYPDRLYLDSKCNYKFPIEISDKEDIKVHRIVVAHSACNACIEMFGGTGSLLIDTSIIGEDHFNSNTNNVMPFVVGQLAPGKGYVHIFDDSSLWAVMNELTTIADFVNYLENKENFITESGLRIRSAGEDDLLAYYLRNINSQGKHCFPFDNNADELVLEEGFWIDYVNSPQRKAKKLAEKESFIWDNLIEFFNNQFNRKVLYHSTDPSFKSHEQNVRYLAQESRLGRRLLSTTFREFIDKIESDSYGFRTVYSDDRPDIMYVFFLVSYDPNDNYDTYRQARRETLSWYCEVVKLKHFPQLKTVIGIATESGGVNAIKTFDLMSLDATTWEDGEQESAINLSNYFFKENNFISSYIDEYPTSENNT